MELEVKQPSGVWLKALVTDVLPPEEPSNKGSNGGGDKLEVAYVNGPVAMQNDWIVLDKCRRPPPPLAGQKDGPKGAAQQQKFIVGQTIEVYLAQAAGASMGWQLAKVKEIKVNRFFTP
jgi:hypothetical protein